jgi:NAD(P)-dependent dehydrogenase (short-subunit alcohol dehydrogenase family)
MTPKTWLITGTSSGFGRALTELLLARGDRVAATLRRPAVLDGLAPEHGERLWRATLDVSDPAAVRRVVDDAFAALGHIDVLVSNAGYPLVGAAEERTDEQVRRQLDIWWCCRCSGTAMRRRRAALSARVREVEAQHESAGRTDAE